MSLALPIPMPTIPQVFARQGFVVINRLAPEAILPNVRDHRMARAATGQIVTDDEQLPYAGKSLTQVFLHHVDQTGHYAEEKIDRRPAPAMPFGTRMPKQS